VINCSCSATLYRHEGTPAIESRGSRQGYKRSDIELATTGTDSGRINHGQRDQASQSTTECELQYSSARGRRT